MCFSAEGIGSPFSFVPCSLLRIDSAWTGNFGNRNWTRLRSIMCIMGMTQPAFTIPEQLLISVANGFSITGAEISALRRLSVAATGHES
jgi:hypothetical protein